MRTTAGRAGDSYVLNGQKNWISYASVADHQLVFAKTDPAAKHKGISAFVVERGWKGVTTQDTENKLGIWAGSTGELFFENVECGRELVGEEVRFEIAMYGSTRAASRSPRAPAAWCAPASSGRWSTRASARRWSADRQVPVVRT
jgi:alkylation response protein AidB-like acyl-CoA dehydrogenase